MSIKLNIDNIDYTCTPTSGLFLLPAGVTPAIFKLNALAAWKGTKDGATKGKATFNTEYPVIKGERVARHFSSVYTDFAGVRFSVVYDTDTASKNFIYSGALWFDSVAGLAQMELDNNQVTADGKTYIAGVQANLNSKKWDVTMCDTVSHWKPTAVNGNPKTWPLGKWLSFEIYTSRDDVGNVTYHQVYFDGTIYPINVTYPSALSLRWLPLGVKVVNFQIGGDGASGQIDVFASNLQIAGW